jgi:hypothetical protein
MPAAPPLIGKRIGRSGLAITLHVKGVLPIDTQMPSRQGRKEPEIRTVHGIAIGSEPTQTRLEMHCVPHHNRRYGDLVSPREWRLVGGVEALKGS